MKRFHLIQLGVAVSIALAAPARADSLPGDTNCDLIVDFDDIDPFVLALIDPDAYTFQFPNCQLGNCDANGDGIVDFDDIDPFVSLLAGGGIQHLELAGNRLGRYPHFEFVAAFNQNEAIEIALDPGRYPGLIGITADIYVIAADSGPELTPQVAPVTVTFSGDSIEGNTVQIVEAGALSADAGLSIGAAYDVVIDVNQNGRLDAGDFIDDGLAEEAGLYVIHDLTQPGPLATTIVNITLKLKVKGNKPARLCYPSNIGDFDRLPLVLIGHGSGHNYKWYDYLLEHLASYGCVVLSHDNDIDGYFGGVPRVLRNADALLEYQDTIEGGVLAGHIDETRFMFIGHSTGGMEVVLAANQLATGKYKPQYFAADALRLAGLIAATSAFEESEGGTTRDYNFHLLWGSADADIGGQPGCDVCQPFRYYDRSKGEKQYTYVHGADHEDFNCCGYNDFNGPKDTEIGREESQRVAKAVYLALAKRYLEGNVPGKELLWRQWERFKPIGVSPDTIVVNGYSPGPAADRFVIDDFQTNDSKTVSSSGGAVSYSVGNLVEGRMFDKNFEYTWQTSDPMNGMTYGGSRDTTRGIVFDWDNAATELEFEVVSRGSDFSPYNYLSFRACQGTRHPFTVAENADLVFDVTLRDSAGNSATINIGAYGGGVEETYRRTGGGSGAGWQNEFETIRIRLSDFLANSTGLNLHQIVAVRFDFGPDTGAAQGRLGFDDIEVSVE